MINTVRVFFSWQSDTYPETNKHLIKRLLSKIQSKLSTESLQIDIDEATKDTSGSPKIDDVILNKIRESDIFVADVTTVNLNSDAIKKTPNPNVVFELGYAVSELGWNRVIMLYNEAYGEYSTDTPFDFKTNRASIYKINSENLNNQNKINALENMLLNAISLIISKNEPKARLLSSLNPEQLKRTNDLNNIRWLLRYFPFSALDSFLESYPNNFSISFFDFMYAFDAIYKSSLFYINNNDMRMILDDLYDLMNKATNYAIHYTINHNNTHYQLSFSKVSPDRITEIELILKEMHQISQQLKLVTTKFKAFLHDLYPEIDIKELDSLCIKNYKSEINLIENSKDMI